MERFEIYRILGNENRMMLLKRLMNYSQRLDELAEYAGRSTSFIINTLTPLKIEGTIVKNGPLWVFADGFVKDAVTICDDSRIYKTLGTESRYKILQLLTENKEAYTTHQVADAAGIIYSTANNQLGRLKKQGFASSFRDGDKSRYYLNDDQYDIIRKLIRLESCD